MSSNRKKKTSDRGILKVRIEKVFLHGLKVKVFNDERIGFVPKQELLWDQSIYAQVPEFEKGMVKEAVEILIDAYTEVPVFSFKRITDPWSGIHINPKYSKGSKVCAEIVNVRHFAAFVQIDPGIIGIIWPKNIPMLKDQVISDVLSVGDKVMGEITNVNSETRQVELSITRYLGYLDENYDSRVAIQLDIFKESFERCLDFDLNKNNLLPEQLDWKRRRYHPPIPFPEKILVIDNDPNDQKKIKKALESGYDFSAYDEKSRERIEQIPNKLSGLKVHKAMGSSDALKLIKTDHKYGLAIVDYNLNEENGVEVANHLRRELPNLPIIFTSTDPFAEEALRVKLGNDVIFCDKKPETIINWYNKLVTGYEDEIKDPKKFGFIEKDSFIRNLEMEAFLSQDVTKKLNRFLKSLMKEIKVKYAFVLKIDFIKKQVVIVAAKYPKKESIYEDYLTTELFYSPVLDVVENQMPFYAVNIDLENDAKFKYFFQGLDFSLSYGMPLKIPDIPVEYALFVLDKRKLGANFEQEELQKIRLTGSFIQVALERELIFDFMRRYEKRYFIGEMQSSLLHELNTKLNGLEATRLLLTNYLAAAKANLGKVNFEKKLDLAIKKADEFSELLMDNAELIHSYSRLVKGDFEEIDLNTVINKITRQFDVTSKEINSDIQLFLEKTLPEISAIPSRLEEVLGNVVLNALQQIKIQAASFKTIAKEKAKAFSFLQKGRIIIQSRRCKKKDVCQILIIDTGPGISYSFQQKIFSLGTSTREEGYGLGLYISRNILQAMGGNLCLLDSIIFVGSVFVIEFPIANN